MSAEFIFRLFGMVLMAIVGSIWGQRIGSTLNLDPSPGTMPVEQYRFLFGLLGALIGLILTPYFTTKPARAIRNGLAKATTQSLLASTAGLMVGLIVAALFLFQSRSCRNLLAASCLLLPRFYLRTWVYRFSAYGKQIYSTFL